MRATIANPSNLRQDRWVTVAAPLSQSAALPPVCIANGFLAVKAGTVGTVSQLWHVRADVPAISEVVLDDWQPYTGTLPGFEGPDWLTDAPELAQWKINLRDGQTWRWLQCTLATAVEVNATLVSRTYRWAHTQGGWHSECWAIVWSGQDAVDIEGYVVWSDPTSPDWIRPDCTISVESGYWDETRTPQHDGEPLSIYWGARSGVVRYDEHRSRLWQGRVPHGCAIPFHGVLLPRRQAPHTAVLSRADRAARAYEAERVRLLDAASQWPLVAAADWTGTTDWLAFGVAPRTLQRRRASDVLGHFAQGGAMLGSRPCAGNVVHGGTGMQEPFGATQDVRVLNGDAWRMLELLHGADQYWYRGCHLRESDGRRTTKVIRPTLETWAGQIESRQSPDRFGKPAGYNGADWGQTFTAAMDDQHRGDAFAIAAYALTGSPMRKALLLDLIATDEMRAMPRRGWRDSPRATGRLWQSWAKIATVLPDEVGRLKALALVELADRESQLLTAGNPVISLETLVDNRLLPGKKAVQGWQNSLACLGALEQAAAWRKLGDAVLADRFAAFAATVGRSTITYQTVTTNGVRTPTYCMHWLDGGLTHPASYYVLPRKGTQSDPMPDGSYDLVEADAGWWSWFSGAVVAAGATDLRARHGGGDDPAWLAWWSL